MFTRTNPGNELPGYFHESLRDRRKGGHRGQTTFFGMDRAKAKALGMVPKMGPAPESVPGTVRATAQYLVRAPRMVQAKDPAAAQEEATVSGLRDGLLRSHAPRGNVKTDVPRPSFFFGSGVRVPLGSARLQG